MKKFRALKRIWGAAITASKVVIKNSNSESTYHGELDLWVTNPIAGGTSSTKHYLPL